MRYHLFHVARVQKVTFSGIDLHQVTGGWPKGDKAIHTDLYCRNSDCVASRIQHTKRVDSSYLHNIDWQRTAYGEL